MTQYLSQASTDQQLSGILGFEHYDWKAGRIHMLLDRIELESPGNRNNLLTLSCIPLSSLPQNLGFCPLPYQQVPKKYLLTACEYLSYHHANELKVEMVKYRGIDISIISQLDICRLPEFSYPGNEDPSNPFLIINSSSQSKSCMASCYVPIYPGSQFWFEYTIDGPHPPGSAYFFKLLMNDKVVTSWDCTAKHDYHGKMMYNLIYDGNDEFTYQPLLRRQGFKFNSAIEEKQNLGVYGDTIEFRVHRIQQRRNMKYNDQMDEYVESNSGNSFSLIDGGLIEPGFPSKRFQYKLLDPVDEPYATFRFYCRSYDYLEEEGIIQSPSENSCFSVDESNQHQESVSISDYDRKITKQRMDVQNSASPKPRRGRTRSQLNQNCSPVQNILSNQILDVHHHQSTSPSKIYQTQNDSITSLSVLTKNSIEDIPSSVQRSPKRKKTTTSITLDESKPKHDHLNPDIPSSPSPQKQSLSNRNKLRKGLKLDDLSKPQIDLENKNRPLSPFTNGGVLRKISNTLTPVASSTLTTIYPSMDIQINDGNEGEEMQFRKLQMNKSEKTKRRSLMSYFRKNVDSEEK